MPRIADETESPVKSSTNNAFGHYSTSLFGPGEMQLKPPRMLLKFELGQHGMDSELACGVR
jgi:hypothetical protein